MEEIIESLRRENSALRGALRLIAEQCGHSGSDEARVDWIAQVARDAIFAGKSTTVNVDGPVDGHMPGPGGMYRTGFMDNWSRDEI